MGGAVADWSPLPGSRWPRLYRRTARLVLVVVVVSGLWIVWSTLFVRTWSDPDAVAAPAESDTLRSVVTELRRDGVLVRPPVRRSLNEVIAMWLRRSDLQRAFRDERGLPNVQGLLAWIDAEPDSSSVSLVDDRGNLAELAGRMGILPADGHLVEPLKWTLRNRRRPVQKADMAIGRLIEVWGVRPDIRAAYTVNGRVKVKDLLFWAANVSGDDASFARLHDVSDQVQHLLEELQGR